MTPPEDALADGDARVAHLAQAAHVRRGGRRSRALPPRPLPPVLVRRAAVERALARDGDVLLLEGVDEGRVVHQLSPLPARVDDGQVLRGVVEELQSRALGDVQVDVALQVNRARHEDARGDDDAPAARAVASLNRLAYRLRVVEVAP